MSVSKKIVDILNQKGVKTDNVVDLFLNWRKIHLSDCDKKGQIKSEKERLIRYSDHDENEETIELLMDLEVNQEDFKYNQEALLTRIKELKGVIEFLVDNYDIDLRDIAVKERGLPHMGSSNKGTIGNPTKVITDEMWLEATKQRRREERLGEILDKGNGNSDM